MHRRVVIICDALIRRSVSEENKKPKITPVPNVDLPVTNRSWPPRPLQISPRSARRYLIQHHPLRLSKRSRLCCLYHSCLTGVGIKNIRHQRNSNGTGIKNTRIEPGRPKLTEPFTKLNLSSSTVSFSRTSSRKSSRSKLRASSFLAPVSPRDHWNQFSALTFSVIIPGTFHKVNLSASPRANC